jgi:arylsulfatase A-like enzyme
LPGRKWFDEHGVSFLRHYTGSLACVPSRPTIFTGHYPDLYGVTQTDGIGKVYDDSRTRWLRLNEVPTLGNWFRAAGYDTHYDGKWHISHADLHDETSGGSLATNDDAGIVEPKRPSATSRQIRLPHKAFRVGRAGAARCAAGQRGSAARPADRRAGGGLVAGALRASARR